MKSLQTIIFEKLKLADIKNFENEYFYHEALEDGYSTWLFTNENVLQYSIDNCKTWNELQPKTETLEISKGERIYFKGENIKAGKNKGIGTFKSNKKFNVGGNIMSLIYGDDFKDQSELIEDHQFEWLFYNNCELISAKDLLLPATKLTESCYVRMFEHCESLTDAPELPATKLTKECYSSMFSWCKLLIKAPKLQATKLATKCYAYMFHFCRSLTEITMLAKDISADNCLHRWVDATSGTCTFTKAKGVNIQEGHSGIPKGWTVKEI